MGGQGSWAEMVVMQSVRLQLLLTIIIFNLLIKQLINNDLIIIQYKYLYNNKINARVLIGQSAMVYCAGKPMEKSRVFWIII